ncbi:NAD(P)-dependent oxidoreductase [Robiginitalea sp. SC105]|uniref:NAD(P)-dependent oxidoreductase n=1 Tax=Robiginitalea sp. SC105 TaxID=2762332 RepID=UPI001639637C|nr:NAD(P)-dependent oxidoreductase [Robiginitalea sp. SC105]MBC2840641.1 3-phosphoglycerate dehydrogenase [Robiginitalea sp. SC105]
MRVLANDGLAGPAVAYLEQAGFEVLTTRVAAEQLAPFLKREKIRALLVRSATQVGRELIDACPDLLLIGRAGVGMDNIDVAHARKKGLHVINTPNASANSVAELVFAHLLGGTRHLHESNRNMPLEGDTNFRSLKKSFSSGRELRGKILGIIGFGGIGEAVARIGLGLGMEVCFHDTHRDRATLTLEFAGGAEYDLEISGYGLEELLSRSDFVTLHVPAQEKPVIGKREIGLMPRGSALINTSRGGVVDEQALLEALDSGHLRFAGLDVFESEPQPGIRLLMNPDVSLSPHIGGSTLEAQERIGMSLAKQVASLLKKVN